MRENECAVEAIEQLCALGVSVGDVQSFLKKRKAGQSDWAAPILQGLSSVWSNKRHGNVKDALSELDLIEWSNKGVIVQYHQRLRANLLYAKGDWEGALQALSMSSGSADQDLAVCCIARRMGECPERDTATDLNRMARLCERLQGTPWGWTALAVYCGARGDWTRALRFAMKGEPNERTQNILGHAYAGQGRFAEAQVHYEAAGLEGLEGLVGILQKQGRQQEALRVAKVLICLFVLFFCHYFIF